MNKILKDLGVVSNNEDGNIIQNLYAFPKEPKKRQARVHVPEKQQIYQADLLYLPEDAGYKYALVVVDCANHAMDAVPLRDKNANTVLNAFEKVFKGKYLKAPKFSMEVDDGKEFKGSVQSFFKQKGIILRMGKPYRHRQQAVVEWMNYIIGKILFMLMSIDELQTGHLSKLWVKDLPDVIESINKNLTVDPRTPKERNIREDALPVGTLVRYALDAPIQVAGEEKLIGKFRAGDIRYSVKPVKIEKIFFRPDQPLLYALEGNKTNTYTRDQLQVYNAKEEKPEPRVFYIEKILERKIEKKKPVYLVKWKGFGNHRNTREPRDVLMKEVPQMVKDFDKANP